MCHIFRFNERLTKFRSVIHGEEFPSALCALGSKGGTTKQKIIVESYLPKMFKSHPGGYFNTASASAT